MSGNTRWIFFSVSIFLIIFTAGCVQLPGLRAQLEAGSPEYFLVESLDVKTDVIPEHGVLGGKNLTVFFDLENGGNITIEGIKITITDPCILEPETDILDVGTLEPGGITTAEIKFRAPSTKIEQDCVIRYRITYDSEATALYPIAAISELEYTRIVRAGRLKEEVPLVYYKTSSPVDIEISISKTQPLLTGSKFYLYTKFINVGAGAVARQRIPAGSIFISYPDWLDVILCDDFDEEGGRLVLNKDLVLWHGETPRSTCHFSVGQVELKQIDQIQINLSYKYEVDDIIYIKVMPE